MHPIKILDQSPLKQSHSHFVFLG